MPRITASEDVSLTRRTDRRNHAVISPLPIAQGRRFPLSDRMSEFQLKSSKAFQGGVARVTLSRQENP